MKYSSISNEHQAFASMSTLTKIYNESVLLGIDVSSLSSLSEKLSDELKPQEIETSEAVEA